MKQTFKRNEEFNENYQFTVDDFKLVDSKQALKHLNDLNFTSQNNVVLIIKQLFKNPYVVISLIVLLAIVLTSIIAPLLSPYNENTPISSGKNSLLNFLFPTWMNGGFSKKTIIDSSDPFLQDLINAKIVDPNKLKDFIVVGANGTMSVVFNPWSHLNSLDLELHYAILGTDGIGRDIWTRLWIGTRQSLALAFLVIFAETIIGVVFGAYIGFHAGSKFDTYAMRLVEIIRSVPQLIWFILLVFILPGGFWTLFLSFTLVGWTLPLARTRIQIIKIKDAEFLKASSTLGTSKNSIIFQHALPNIFGKILPNIILRIPSIIFMESSLAFLGLSSSPESASLGNLINDAKGFVQYWWYLLAPTSVILLLTISAQIIGNGLHDAFEPRSR